VPGHVHPDPALDVLPRRLHARHLRVEAQQRGDSRVYPQLQLADGGRLGEHEMALPAHPGHGRRGFRDAAPHEQQRHREQMEQDGGIAIGVRASPPSVAAKCASNTASSVKR
jgi:hypothetical protein